MNISNALSETSARLGQAGIAESSREASLLLSLASGKDKTFQIAYPEYELSAAEERRLEELTARRAAREPYQYISGHQEFFGLDFEVSEDVLIPRPETEILVEKAIKILELRQDAFFAEVGVGSGCISVSILFNVASARAIGADISPAAITIAAKNAAKHHVLDRLELVVSDVYSNIEPIKFDLIVSNPPYVPLADMTTLQAEVRDFEPHLALTDGKDGLSLIRRLIADAPLFLKAQGEILIEIGYDQSERVSDFFVPGQWHALEFLPDLQGIPRIAHAVLK